MPYYLYKPIPEGHRLYPGMQRTKQPEGIAPEITARRMGWHMKPPPGVAVYDIDGTLMRPADVSSKPTINGVEVTKDVVTANSEGVLKDGDPRVPDEAAAAPSAISDDDDKDRAIEAARRALAGESVSTLANEYGVSKPTIYRWKNEYANSV